MCFARKIIAIEHEVRFHAEVDEHTYAVHDKVDVLAGGFALGQLNGTRHGAAVHPAICVDSERLASEVAEMSGLVDALQQREQACAGATLGQYEVR